MSRDETQQKYDDLIVECDRLIKAGKISAVTHLISRLNLAQVPRSARQSLAKICRRSDLIAQGLRLLQPIIRQEKQKMDNATPGEICEYAVLLSRNGSIQEAKDLLVEIDPSTVPEASLYLAYCHISNWDYAKAVKLIESFLDSPADDYAKLIARVNLISAYLAVSELDQAAELLEETIPMAEKTGASRLVGNCFELRSRVHLYRGNFPEARLDLQKALEIFASSQSYDRLFINKWQAVMSAIEKKSIEPLVQFRQEALSKKDWESVREADLFTTKVQFDQKLLDHLTFGSPMASYRLRIQHEVGGQPSESFIFGQEGANCLDLKTGKIEGGANFNPGKKIHQVIVALVRDFYAPRNVGTLFSELYQNEYFDINSSPRRVRELLRRTRQWLKDNDIPASIQQSNGSYRFVINGTFGIKIPLEGPAIESSSMYWQQLKSVFQNGSYFSAKQACQTLNWPRSSFLVVAERALKAGDLIKTGHGKSTRYQVSAVSEKKTSNSAA